MLAEVNSLGLEPSLTLSVDVGSADHSVVEVADSVAVASEVHVAVSVVESVTAGVASTTGVSEYEGTAEAVAFAHHAVNSAKVALTSVALSARID